MSRIVNLYEVTYSGYVENSYKVITVAASDFREAENAVRVHCHDTNFKVHCLSLKREGVLVAWPIPPPEVTP